MIARDWQRLAVILIPGWLLAALCLMIVLPAGMGGGNAVFLEEAA